MDILLWTCCIDSVLSQAGTNHAPAAAEPTGAIAKAEPRLDAKSARAVEQRDADWRRIVAQDRGASIIMAQADQLKRQTQACGCGLMVTYGHELTITYRHRCYIRT